MKIIITIFLLLIAAFSLTLGVDENAMILHDEAFERAMVAFGLAKGLNAVISLIQGTQLSFAPVGVGLNFSIGEVLDPFNDMVERFSWVMLLASVSLGIQKIILLLSSKIFLQIALALSAAISLFFIWNKKYKNKTAFILSAKVLIIILLLRFTAIVFVYTSDALYHSVLDMEYKSSSEVLERTKDRLEDIQSKNKNLVESKKESAWYELDVNTKYQELKAQLNISEQLESVQNSIEDASRKIITLITIFVIQSILMPLLFLWLLVAGIRWTFRSDFNENKMVSLLK